VSVCEGTDLDAARRSDQRRPRDGAVRAGNEHLASAVIITDDEGRELAIVARADMTPKRPRKEVAKLQSLASKARKRA